MREASSGEPRAVRGELIGEATEDAAPEPVAEGDEHTLEDVLADARVVRERLRTARRWLERLAPGKSAGTTAEVEADADGSLRERLERQARAVGYGRVVAAHRIEDHPSLLVSELSVEGLRVPAMGDDLLDVQGWNLSSHPHLLAEAPRLVVASRSGRLRTELDLDAEDGRLLFALRDVPVDDVAGGLVAGGAPLVTGGTADLVLDGGWRAGRVGELDLPLALTLHGSTLQLPGREPAFLERFELPVALRGPLDGLALRIDDDELVAALVASGQRELARRLRSEVDGRVEQARDAASEAVSEAVGDELEARGLDVDDVTEDVQSGAEELLRGVFGKP